MLPYLNARLSAGYVSIVMTLVAMGVALILFSLLGFYSAIRPDKIISTITPQHYGLHYENVSFFTADHVLIRGWFIKSSHPAAKTIILLHGYPADKGNILPATLFLHDQYNLLYIDFRYFGESAGLYSSIGGNEVLDLLGAINYLRTRHINEVGVWGFSMGGAVALMAAARAPEIKAMVIEASYAQLNDMSYEYYAIPVVKYVLGGLTRIWGWLFLQMDMMSVSPFKSAANINIPVLIIHSKQDDVIPFQHALLLQSALKHNPLSEFLFVKNARHGEHTSNYDQVVEQFYKRYLK